MCDQAKLLPVKTSNLLDNSPMTDCYLQAENVQKSSFAKKLQVSMG